MLEKQKISVLQELSREQQLLTSVSCTIVKTIKTQISRKLN